MQVWVVVIFSWQCEEWVSLSCSSWARVIACWGMHVCVGGCGGVYVLVRGPVLASLMLVFLVSSIFITVSKCGSLLLFPVH